MRPARATRDGRRRSQLRGPPSAAAPPAAEAERVHRVALLIDARRISADVATGLLAQLAERGTVNVCRAYADWNSVGRR